MLAIISAALSGELTVCAAEVSPREWPLLLLLANATICASHTLGTPIPTELDRGCCHFGDRRSSSWEPPGHGIGPMRTPSRMTKNMQQQKVEEGTEGRFGKEVAADR